MSKAKKPAPKANDKSKAAAKPAAKAAAKTATKPAAKSPVKSAAKSVAKPTAKATAKPVAKLPTAKLPAVKPTAKPVVAKPAAKTPAKGAQVKAKSAAKTPPAKHLSKTTEKVQEKSHKGDKKESAKVEKIEAKKSPAPEVKQTKEDKKSAAKDKKKAKKVGPDGEEDFDPFLDDDFADVSDEVYEEVVEEFTAVAETVLVDDDASEEVILTDAEGNPLCKVKECDDVATTDGYCRLHYLTNWKRIQLRRKILAGGKLDRYIEELTSRYPDKYLEVLRKDLSSEKNFMAALSELEIEDTGDAEFEDEAQELIDEVRGSTQFGGGGKEDEEF